MKISPDTNLFIFHSGMAYPSLETWAVRRRSKLVSTPILKLAKLLEYRRNPRSREYMQRTAGEVVPALQAHEVRVVGSDRRLDGVDWAAVKNVVLLWPDANGTGWAGIERQVFRRKRLDAGVFVLNGRRRCFVLNRMDRRGFIWRRALEKTLAVELILLLGFVVTTPWLLAWDLINGRD